jgi:uncharacterized membrane protein YdjX (TVP38/TMEM64 family)
MQKFLKKGMHFSIMLLFIGVLVAGLFGVTLLPQEALTMYFEAHALQGITGVIIAMFLGTVIAPIAIVPIIPLIAPMLGPFQTGVASWVGWTLGAVVAFCIARYGGKPLLMRFVSLEALNRYEARIPHETHFSLIFALRIVIPVDLLSYALGLFSRVPLGVYTAASALGIMWFSFAFSYLGYAVTTHNTVLLVNYSVASAIIFLGALLYVYTTIRSTRDVEK